MSQLALYTKTNSYLLSILPKWRVICLILITILFAITARAELPVAENGQLDLSAWNFQQNGLTNLNGEWAYYPHQLLTTVPSSPANQWFRVPDMWGDEAKAPGSQPGFGYATFILNLKLPDSAINLGLRLKSMSSAYKLFANGQLIASVGTVSNSPKDFQPQFKPIIATLPSSSEITLVLQVANYRIASGGPWNVIKIGTLDKLQEDRLHQTQLALTLCTFALIIGFYHFVFWAVWRKNISPLFFGALCLAVALRSLTLDEIYLVSLISELSFDSLKRTEYASMILIYALNWLFFRSLYPQEFTRNVILVNTIPCAVYLLLIIFSSPTTFTPFLYWFQGLIVLGFIIGWSCLLLAVFKRRIGAKAFAFSMVILMVFTAHDISASSSDYAHYFIQLYDLQLLPIGYVIVLLTQSVIIGRQSQAAMHNLKLRTNELASANMKLDKQAELLEQQVKERTAQLKSANKKLRELARLDDLTQLANRRAFNEQMTYLWASHARNKQPLSLLFIDVDNFKQFNDEHGHIKGDEALTALAEAFKTSVDRSTDFVARYGGEEFAIILPGTNLQGAIIKANAVQDSVLELNFPFPASDYGHLTISVGVASVQPSQSESPESLIELADQRLYRAKELGRNKVVSES